MKINFKVVKSDKLTKIQKLEIIDLFDNTFSNSMSLRMFEWKYLKNPFGSSLHLLGYLNNKLVLNRSFWKLKFSDNTYQCVDTCVSTFVQGKGIFKKSHLFLENSYNNLSYYNLPNNISKPVYLRLGWRVIEKTKIKLTIPLLLKNHNIPFNDNEINWRYNLHPNKTYYKIRQGMGYVICFFKYNFLPIAVGYTTIELNLKTIYSPLVFSYDKNVIGFSIPMKENVIISKNFNKEVNFYNFDMF